MSLSAKELLFYGFGQVAYAVAKADNKVQTPENERFKALIREHLHKIDPGLDIAQIIFHLIKQEDRSAEDAYEIGIQNMKLGAHYLTPELKSLFIKALEEIAGAYESISEEEKAFIERFKKDLERLQ